MKTKAKLAPLLSLMQITDSALPIGSFSHSWGLETFVQNNCIRNGGEALSAVQNMLHFSVAAKEGRALALAYYAEQANDQARLESVNEYLDASNWCDETRQASLSLGKRLTTLCRHIGFIEDDWSQPARSAHWHHAVVVARLGARLDIKLDELLAGYLQSTLTAMVASLVKLVPLGHSEGQLILAKCQITVAELAEQISREPEPRLDDIAAFAPLSEWASIAHQNLYSRLFQS